MSAVALYDLQLASGVTVSPFVWMTRLALAHKGLEVDRVSGGFTGILERTGGRTERLPAIVDRGEWVLDSWGIAEYLDRAYPDRPALIGDAPVTPLAQFLERWFWQEAIWGWVRCYVVSLRARALPEDRDHLTRTRERMFGAPLETVVAGREDRLPLIPPTLEPLRGVLRDHRWLGGERPGYADYRLLGAFLFIASIADTPPLTEDEPLRDWIEQGFDLFDGIGRHPALSPLFGLELRDGDPAPFNPDPPVNGLTRRNTGPGSTPVANTRPSR